VGGDEEEVEEDECAEDDSNALVTRSKVGWEGERGLEGEGTQGRGGGLV
jgi:hypothetical protein